MTDDRTFIGVRDDRLHNWQRRDDTSAPTAGQWTAESYDPSVVEWLDRQAVKWHRDGQHLLASWYERASAQIRFLNVPAEAAPDLTALRQAAIAAIDPRTTDYERLLAARRRDEIAAALVRDTPESNDG